MRKINPETINENDNIIIKMPDCPGHCLKVTKGAEYPTECENYVLIGGEQYCNNTCLE